MPFPAPVVAPAASTHTATVIFFHGLGDSGHGWIHELHSIVPRHVKVICPNAPTSAVTLNGGMRMPSWFDIRSLDSKNEDKEGITKAVELAKQFIVNEMKESNIPANRLVIGGFSQGAALALHTALTFSETLAGVVVLSGWLPIESSIDWSSVMKPPILMAHGEADPIVDFRFGKASAEAVQSKAAHQGLEFKAYPGMGHSSGVEELQHIKEFFAGRLPPL